MAKKEKEKEEKVPKKTAQEKEAQLVSKFHQRYNRSETAFASLRREWAELDALDRGEHWDGVTLPPWVPKPTHNMIRYIRTLKRANLASNIPVATYTPLNKDHEDIFENIQRAYKHVWTVEKVPRTVRRCIDRALLQGTAIAMIYTDETHIDGMFYTEDDVRNQLYQGRIIVKRIPIATFHPDPDAYDIDTCKFIELTYNAPLEEIKKNESFKEYAGAKLQEYQGNQVAATDAESGEIFKRDVKLGQGGMNAEGDDMATVHVHYERSYSPSKKRYQLNVYYYMAGCSFLLYKEEDLKPNVYPFAVLYDEEEENSFFGTGTAKDIAEQQKVINKANQTASVIGVLHQNPQKIVSAESGINAKEMAQTGSLPGKVWKTNGDPARSIHVLQPPDIPRGLFEMKDRNIQDIKETVGINEAYTGQSVGSLTTSTGVNSLIDRSTIRDRDKMTQIDDFVEAISDLIVLNIIHKWKDKRPVINIGTNGQVERFEFDPIDEATADNLHWFVKSDVYTKAPTSQARRQENAQALLQLQGQFSFNPPIITPEEYMYFTDYDIKDEIIERMEIDRVRMQTEEAMNLANMITQIADIGRQLRSQGLPDSEIQTVMQQQAQALIDERNQSEMMGRSRDAAKPTQAPQGTTGVQAMNNMTAGV